MPRKLSQFPTAAEFLPPDHTLPALRGAAVACRGCDLFQHGTQTVFGEGAANALVMFVGEQPGEQEDRSGRPFVGPAGRLLDQALAEAQIDRKQIYLTNAVKHFKWEQRGNRRIHAKPSTGQINACRPWLIAEIEAIKPRLIVCLGATAAQSLLGPEFRLTQHRGQTLPSPWAPRLLATVHPSALLRIPDQQMRQAAYRQFVDDLRLAAQELRAVQESQPILFPPRLQQEHPGQDAAEPRKRFTDQRPPPTRAPVDDTP